MLVRLSLSMDPMNKLTRGSAIGPLKPHTIYDNIPRLVDIDGDRLSSTCGSGGIGRRAGFRFQCLMT